MLSSEEIINYLGIGNFLYSESLKKIFFTTYKSCENLYQHCKSHENLYQYIKSCENLYEVHTASQACYILMKSKVCIIKSLLVLCTRNNTDGNKLVVFSSIALYYGDNDFIIQTFDFIAH